MKYLNHILLLFFGLFPLSLSAQANESLHQNGKIYVVIGVILLIFLGILLLLVSLERRLARLEKESK